MPVDYDSFMKLDLQGRIKTFNEISPENRATIVRTQIERWTGKNRARLTHEQVALMEENSRFATAEIYAKPMTDDVATKAKELETRAAVVFSREDMRQALTIHGDHIPKSP
jgi:hypothetical protein